MNKKLIPLMAAAVSAVCGSAAIPVVEETPATASGFKALPAKQSVRAAAGVEHANTFFEGFEGRPSGYGTYYDEWLPEGWQDVSKSGQTVPVEGEYRHNLTWRVLSDDDRDNAPTCVNYAFEGDCFAFIMADVAYGNHTDLAVQDEWLISPEFTPVEHDWLYFQLFHNAAWATYNRAENNFTGRNSELDVHISTDGGATWTRIWNEIDDEIIGKYTEEELRSILIDIYRTDFDPVYVNLKDYVGQKVKVAFRFHGSTGHGVALDNVAVGVPMPVARYEMPAGFFMQGLSPKVEYPAERKLLMPFNKEAKWVNRSELSLAYEWTYTDASGAAAVSDSKNLVTPAYPYGSTAATPTLTGIFETRRSETYSVPFATMQAGGILRGTDTEGNDCEFGTGYYNIGDPNHKIVISSRHIGFNPDIDDSWEMLLGMQYNSLDVEGIVNYYPASSVPYGFDFIDVPVIVNHIEADTEAKIMVFDVNDAGNPGDLIGYASIMGSEFPENPGNFVNLHFRFDVPVYARRDIMVLMGGFNRELDNVVIPYVKTTSPNYGNSMLYVWAYDAVAEGWYDTFYSLNGFPLTDNYHFAGVIMTLGTSYSSLDLLEGEPFIEAPAEGCRASFLLHGTHPVDRWALTENGVTVADWADCKFAPEGENTRVELNVKPVEAGADFRDTWLYVVTPGSRVGIHVLQEGDESSIAEIGAPEGISVVKRGAEIIVDGTDEVAKVYNAAGALVVSGRRVIAANGLLHGVYMVQVGGKTVKILL